MQFKLATMTHAQNSAAVTGLGLVMAVIAMGIAVPIAIATPITSAKDQSRYRVTSGVAYVREYDAAVGQYVSAPTPEKQGVRPQRVHGLSVDRAPQPLRDALALVQQSCSGVQVISNCRPGSKVRGSGRRSLHASCQAIDFKVSDSSCPPRVLAGFPGGMSKDYKRVGHYHISYAPGGREWGARFAHYSGKRHAKRIRKHTRVARAA